MSRAVLRLGSLLVALSSAPLAHAQSDTRAAVAEGLYRQARDLMAAGKHDEACPKFAESHRLDPATGTLLNLAACHERQGKFATAWIEYTDAMVAARRDQREDRVEYARARSQELEPKLSRLTLLLAPDAEHAGIVLELDNATLGGAVIGAPMPVDPGSHVVRVTAPGKKPWSRTVEIGPLADQQTLTIPQLELAPPEPVAPPQASTLTPPIQNQPARDSAGTRPIPTSVYLAGGVTLALAAGAGVTGVAYLKKRATYDDERPDGGSDTLAAQERTAKQYGYINAGFWAATVIGAGVTTVLYVTRPEQKSATRVVPWAAPHSAGLSVTGGF